MSYVAPAYRALGPALVEKFKALRSAVPDKRYKVMIHDGLDGRVMQWVVWYKRNNLYGLFVTWHNLSRTTIKSKRQVTSLNLLITLENSEVTRSRIAPSTSAEVTAYCTAYPTYAKTLIK